MAALASALAPHVIVYQGLITFIVVGIFIAFSIVYFYFKRHNDRR